MKKGTRRDVITASEISQYSYCPIAWYLERCGSKPESPGLVKGTNEHANAGRMLSAVQNQERSLKILRFVEYLALVCAFAGLWWFLWFRT